MFLAHKLRAAVAGSSSLSYTWNGQAFGSGAANANDNWVMNLGTPDPNRYVVVVTTVGDNNATSINSVTCGGVGMTRVAYGGEGAGYYNYSGVYIVAYPTGTSASIQVNTATGTQTVVTCYSLYNISSITPVASAQLKNATTMGTTLTGLPNKSIVIGVAGTTYSNSSVSWTGITYDIKSFAGTTTMGAASTQMTAAGDLYVQASFGAPGSGTTFNVAAWY